MVSFHRFNSGGNWGLGHLYRNISLLSELRKNGLQCVAVINDSPIAMQMLSSNNIEFVCVPEFEKPEDLIQIVYETYREVPLTNKCIFWDRLNSTYEYINVIIKASIKIITFGDYDESCFLATESIISRDTLVNGKKVKYTGPSYQLLSEKISHYAKLSKVINNKVSNVLLHFGGTDPQQILTFSFEILKNKKEIHFTFIDGKNQSNKALEEKCAKLSGFEYLVGVDNFAERLYKSDLCILAGGVSMFEAAAIGTPMINICQNDDQQYAAQIFQEKAGTINLGKVDKIYPKRYLDIFDKMCNDYKSRQEMAKKMKQYVDSNGTKRVCKIIKQVIER